jgi:dihydroxy-acid dehydratase
MLKKKIKAKQILTYNAFKNAIVVLYSVGGSTNAVLHLLAIANEVGI